MSKISVDYEECNSFIAFMDKTLSDLNDENKNLSNALTLAAGCVGGASASISTAINELKTVESKLQSFKSDFKMLIEDIKTYDSDFEGSMNKVENFIGNSISTFFNIATSGTDGGYGAYKSIVSGFNSKCYIELTPEGKYRIVGSTLDREALGVKANGATYRIGSQSFYAAGLDRYLPKGSSFSEYAERYIKNLKGDLSKASAATLSNPGAAAKSFASGTYLFKPGDKIGNAAKGLAYASIAYDTVSHGYTNIKNGASSSKIVADGVTDVAKGLGGMAVATACAEAGAAIGTAIPIPVVGTVAGAALGFVAGYAGASVYNYFVGEKKFNGKTAAEWVSSGIEKGLDEAGAALNKAKNSVGDFFSGASKFVFG